MVQTGYSFDFKSRDLTTLRRVISTEKKYRRMFYRHDN